MTSTEPVAPIFGAPRQVAGDAVHHAQAAAGNALATEAATAELLRVLDGESDRARILLKAAAGAGKSFALKRMVAAALGHAAVDRVGVVAFANKQLFPLAKDLGTALGPDVVCLYVSKHRVGDVDQSTRDACTVAGSRKEIPATARVLLITSHMAKTGHDLRDAIGPVGDNTLFDVVFVDEAWQLPLHLYKSVSYTAPVTVGVGDVGQLPPLDNSNNPYRGDGTYNPYRAWPTAYEDDERTWARELPAVWRPTAQQLALWRAFYPEWGRLDSVAGPGDRSVDLGHGLGTSHAVWGQVATGCPTLVEVEGLAEPDAPDVDPPLLGEVERWLDELLTAGFTLRRRTYDDAGVPVGEETLTPADARGETLIALLATRNQAVDDAMAVVERLRDKHDLAPGVLIASTVDSWQGQTNALTVAIHPLSGAFSLDEFNSAFGRLAVTCTRATHGLLLVARPGLDDVLRDAPARPGTPFGEPGTRALPRQTHQRILETFARARIPAADGTPSPS